ncbi:hypothetical protein ACODYM_29315 [Burkholderia gladioli]|uniref:hypothetical protein n=1 Tax=Burkholderia gladioli TaxID=28095 RepID=UPI003B512D6B
MSDERTDYVMADETGLIVGKGSVPSFMFGAQVPPAGGSLAVGDGNPDLQYVSGQAIVDRPANPATLDGMTLKTLPVPCTINVEGVDHACDADHCDLSFSAAGTYSVVVRAWPAVDAVFEVTQS